MRRVLPLLLTAALLAACADEDLLATPTPIAEASIEATPAPTTRPTRTPTPAPTPRAVATARARAEWHRVEPSSATSFTDRIRTVVYDVDSDELWTLSAEDGSPYSLVWSPFSDLAIGTIWNAYEASDAETVLIDPSRGSVRQVLPFAIAVVDWPEPDRIIVRVGIVVGGRDGPEGWTRGLYELDLAGGTMMLLEVGDQFSGPHPQAVPVPDGSTLPPGRIELRLWPNDGWRSLVHVSPTGQESTLADRLADVVWSGSERRLATVTIDGDLEVLDLETAQSFTPGDGPHWSAVWSNDGRYLATWFSSRQGAVGIFDLGVPGTDWQATPVRTLGPFDATAFADWGPGATPSEALLLGDYCLPDGFRLDRLDLSTEEIRRIPTELGGFWVYDWSPRGDLIAVSSWDVGFELIDPDTGLLGDRPVLSAVVTTMQDVAWSAGGRWLALHDIGGRDRCNV
ncbi:MAG: hypothetical protein R3C39_09005 [Dehalococcoidia bacterium]